MSLGTFAGGFASGLKDGIDLGDKIGESKRKREEYKTEQEFNKWFQTGVADFMGGGGAQGAVAPEAAASAATAPGEKPTALHGGAYGVEIPPSLIQNESGGNWRAQNNEKGASGLYGHYGRLQFGKARLSEVAQGLGVGHITPEQFMSDPELQKRAEQWHFSDIDRFVKTEGLDQYFGKSIGGVHFTPEAARSIAHLGGKAGLRQFVKTNGKYNPADVNRTSLADYGKRHGGSQQQPTQQAVSQPQASDFDTFIQQNDPSKLANFITEARTKAALSPEFGKKIEPTLKHLEGLFLANWQAQFKGDPSSPEAMRHLGRGQGFLGVVQDPSALQKIRHAEEKNTRSWNSDARANATLGLSIDTARRAEEGLGLQRNSDQRAQEEHEDKAQKRKMEQLEINSERVQKALDMASRAMHDGNITDVERKQIRALGWDIEQTGEDEEHRDPYTGESLGKYPVFKLTPPDGEALKGNVFTLSRIRGEAEAVENPVDFVKLGTAYQGDILVATDRQGNAWQADIKDAPPAMRGEQQQPQGLSVAPGSGAAQAPAQARQAEPAQTKPQATGQSAPQWKQNGSLEYNGATVPVGGEFTVRGKTYRVERGQKITEVE